MYKIYTDGACSGNNRSKQCPGGYGYVIVDADLNIVEGGGKEKTTTNNRMEMKSVIEGMKQLKKQITKKNEDCTKSICLIITDSRYVCDNWNEYFQIWKANNWRKSNGGPVLNIDLWKEIEKTSSEFGSVEFQWIKGHANNQFNTRADAIARSNIRNE